MVSNVHIDRYSGSRDREFAIVFAPGLVTKGRSERIFRSAVDTLREQGMPITTLTYGYTSHEKLTLSGFENDLADLEVLAGSLEKEGIQRNRIGFMGTCYGAYLVAQHIETHPGTPFGILAEPYFGVQSLAQPYRMLSRKVSALPTAIGKKIKIPSTHHGKVSHWIPLQALSRFVKKNVALNDKVPTLAFLTGVHSFFCHASINADLKRMNSTQVTIGPEYILNEDSSVFSRNIGPFLERIGMQ